jgi:TonB family protein
LNRLFSRRLCNARARFRQGRDFVIASAAPRETVPMAFRPGARYHSRGTISEADVRILQTGAMFAAGALMLSGTGACLADTAAKIDHSRAAPAPDYPDGAQLLGEQGDVLLDIQVASNGRPERIRVKQSSGYRDLDDAAVGTAANWHYMPAMAGGDAELGWAAVRIRYQLPQAAPATKSQ